MKISLFRQMPLQHFRGDRLEERALVFGELPKKLLKTTHTTIC